MVKIAWELLTTFNCWQLLSSSGVGQWWWGGKKPWQAGSNYSLCLSPARWNRGWLWVWHWFLSRPSLLLQPRLCSLAPSLIVTFRGAVETRRGWKSWGDNCQIGVSPTRRPRGGLCVSPKNGNPPLGTFQSRHDFSPAAQLPSPTFAEHLPAWLSLCQSQSQTPNRKGDKDSFFH